jgi:hypothetical protein
MQKTFLFRSILAVFACMSVSAIPSAACGNCNCQNVEHIIVTCAACDTQIDTYPPVKGSFTSCNVYAPLIIDCCHDSRTPESTSINEGACSGSSCGTVVCAAKEKSVGPSPVSDSSAAPSRQRR